MPLAFHYVAPLKPKPPVNLLTSFVSGKTFLKWDPHDFESVSQKNLKQVASALLILRRKSVISSQQKLPGCSQSTCKFRGKTASFIAKSKENIRIPASDHAQIL